jgi:hypothetical protein
MPRRSIATQTLSSGELARVLGISLASTRSWIAKDMLHADASGRFPLIENVNAYTAHMRNLVTGRGDDAEREARRRMTAARAALLEAKAKAITGRVVDRDEGDRFYTACFRLIWRTIMSTLPARFAGHLGGDVKMIMYFEDEFRAHINGQRQTLPQELDRCCPKCGFDLLAEYDDPAPDAQPPARRKNGVRP